MNSSMACPYDSCELAAASEFRTAFLDRKSTRLNSSHGYISYAVFCLKENDVVAMGGDVILSSTGDVEGEVVTLGGHLRESPGSHVGGHRVAAGGVPRGMVGAPFLGLL